MNVWDNKDFDPYKDLVELKNFATSADTHIANLVNNEKQIISAVNDLSQQLKQIKQKIRLLEKCLDEITRQKR
jgi:hypothetical protein